jgi:hypothetical protein
MVFSVIKVSAQDESDEIHKAPTLQVGLDGIIFKRGDLDAQLIIQMVAEAQRHVALKIVENMFLKKLHESGGAVYSFADNIIQNIVEEKDTDLRTKRIFENTVNIVFTYAFLKYYVETLDITRQNGIFATMLTGFNSGFTYRTPYTLKGLKGLSRTGINDFYDNPVQYKLIATLMDMASLAISQDKQLKDLGLMQVSHSASYDYLNEYNRLLLPDNASLLTMVKPVYEDMVNTLGQLTRMIGLVKVLVAEKSFRNDQTKLMVPISPVGVTVSSVDDSRLISKITTASASIQAAVVSIVSTGVNDADGKTDLANLTNYISLLNKAERILKNIGTGLPSDEEQGVVSDLLYTVYDEIIPGLKKLSFRDASLSTIATTLSDFTVSLAGYMQANFPNASSISGSILPFLQLVSRLYEFDRTTTFSEYTKLIADLENIFPNDFAKEALSVVNSFVRDHVQFIKVDGKEVVDFKIESFIRKLQDIKPYKYSPLQFHMTVGMNSGFFYKNPLKVDGVDMNNFSYVGEKIGVKFKLIDWDFWQTRKPGETYRIYGTPYIKTAAPVEPVVSNIHLLAYGSGLLYNIINTSTQNNFNGALAGFGAGITFTRLLDFNLSYCIPIVKGVTFKESFDYGFIGAGFDVQFGAYLDRVAQKRSQKKVEKNAVNLMSQKEGLLQKK